MTPELNDITSVARNGNYMCVVCTLVDGIDCHWWGNNNDLLFDGTGIPCYSNQEGAWRSRWCRTEDDELDLADHGHHYPAAELGQDPLIPGVDHLSCSNLQRDIGTFSWISATRISYLGTLPF